MIRRKKPSSAKAKLPGTKAKSLKVDHPEFGKTTMDAELMRNRDETLLLQNMRQQLPALKALLAKADDHSGMEDGVYRFYHQSVKVFGLQSLTLEITEALKQLLPDHPLNEWFAKIVAEGTQRTFEPEDNTNWLAVTRPIVEAFFHAHFMLKMVCKYGEELDTPPQMMPSGWAAVLYLFNCGES